LEQKCPVGLIGRELPDHFQADHCADWYACILEGSGLNGAAHFGQPEVRRFLGGKGNELNRSRQRAGLSRRNAPRNQTELGCKLRAPGPTGAFLPLLQELGAHDRIRWLPPGGRATEGIARVEASWVDVSLHIVAAVLSVGVMG
jgi:hypothetical protein